MLSVAGLILITATRQFNAETGEMASRFAVKREDIAMISQR